MAESLAVISCFFSVPLYKLSKALSKEVSPTVQCGAKKIDFYFCDILDKNPNLNDVKNSDSFSRNFTEVEYGTRKKSFHFL